MIHDTLHDSINFTVPQGACDCQTHVFGPTTKYGMAVKTLNYLIARSFMVMYKKKSGPSHLLNGHVRFEDLSQCGYTGIDLLD